MPWRENEICRDTENKISMVENIISPTWKIKKKKEIAM